MRGARHTVATAAKATERDGRCLARRTSPAARFLGRCSSSCQHARVGYRPDRGVYLTADQMISRGGAVDIHARMWCRHMFLCIALSDPDFWNSQSRGERAQTSVRLRSAAVSHTANQTTTNRQMELARALRPWFPQSAFVHIVLAPDRKGSDSRDTTQWTLMMHGVADGRMPPQRTGGRPNAEVVRAQLPARNQTGKFWLSESGWYLHRERCWLGLAYERASRRPPTRS